VALAPLLSRAMSQPGNVPDHVEYRRFATQSRAIEGIIPLASLPRVLAVAFQAPPVDAAAHVRLVFTEDSQRRVRVTGWVSADLVLQCQRCTRAFVQAVVATVAGVIVNNDAAAADVPRADEPILVAGDTLDVCALVADELLLALPMVARCDDPTCRTRYESRAADGSASAPTRADNPFAALGQLKRGDDTD